MMPAGLRLGTSGKSPSVVAQLLLCRGIDQPAMVLPFLEPKLTELFEPDSLPGVPTACDIIMAAIAAREPIVVYGDYDADGMTSTAILHECLRLMEPR